MWEQPEIPTVLQVRDQVSEGVYRGQKGRAFQGPGSLLLGGGPLPLPKASDTGANSSKFPFTLTF